MSETKPDSTVKQSEAQRQFELPTILASPAALAIHHNFCNAVTGLRRELVRSIYYLRLIYERNIYRALGYSNIRHYAADHGGLTERQCKAFLRLGARLDDLPAMKKALAEGSLTWRKANAIVGEADSQNEEELVNLAKQLSEDALRRVAPKPRATHNDRPTTPTPTLSAPLPAPPKPPCPPTIRPQAEPCYVAFKFTPEQYSLWAAFNARKGRLTKEEALIEAMRGGVTDQKASGTGYVLILQECPACRRVIFTNNRGTFEAPQALLEAAHCDGIIQDQDARRRRVIPPRLKRQVLQRDSNQCQAEGCPNTQHLQIHHRLPVAQGGDTKLQNLVTLCARCHRVLHESEEALRQQKKDPMG